MSKKNKERSSTKAQRPPEIGTLGVALQQAGFKFDSTARISDSIALTPEQRPSPPAADHAGAKSPHRTKDIPVSWNDPSLVRIAALHIAHLSSTDIPALPRPAPSTSKLPSHLAAEKAGNIVRAPNNGEPSSFADLPKQKAPVMKDPANRTIEPSAKKTGQHSPSPVSTSLESQLVSRMAELSANVESRAMLAANQTHPSEEDIRELSARLAAGGEKIRSGPVVDVVLGIDFGTSSSKLVARRPYVSGAPAVTIPAILYAQAESHSHLWASRLWLDSSGYFSLTPTDSATLLCGIKSALMGDSPHTKFVIHAGDAHATALEAAAAFLALQMRQARGWLNKNRPEFTRANLRWWYNIGFPAAKLDQTHLSRYYNTCVAAAIKALHFDGPLSVTLMRRLVSETNAAELTSLNGALVPEVAAAVASFAKSFRRETGLYVMVDVGASTLDCCTFSLSSQNGFPKCPIFLADVSLRGVQPWECCEGDDPLKTAFEQDVRNRKRGVIWHTKSRRDPMSNRWREGLPVFLIGGGSSANMYQKAVASLDPWLRTYIRSSNGVRLIHLTEPENVEYQCPTVSVHRLAVGIGLSYHTLDIDEIVLPRDIEDISRLPVREYEDIYGK